MLNAIRDYLVRYAHQGISRNADRVVALCEANPRATVLDLGCGDGTFTARVRQKVGAVKAIGIDVVSENLAAARAKGIVGIEADLNRVLPLADETVDVVVASQVIEHVSDTDMFVKEMYRILSPGGYAVVATPNLAAWYNVLFLILGQQPPSTCVSDVAPLGLMARRVWAGRYTARVGHHQVSNKHRRVFVRSTLVGLLEYYGFCCEKVIVSGFPPLPWFAADLACRLLPMYAWNLIVRARKPG